MAKGDPLLSPWVWDSRDYLGRAITITVPFNNTTRALQTATVTRDPGCMYTKIVFDVPSSGTSKRLAAPTDAQGDRTYSPGQMSGQGLNVIEDVLALQITAEP